MASTASETEPRLRVASLSSSAAAGSGTWSSVSSRGIVRMSASGYAVAAAHGLPYLSGGGGGV
jgi:hypothetical protein